MYKNNKGFTLVELMISITIFAVVVTAALGFMLAGSRSYSSVTNRVNLDFESQLAMNQLSDYIIDCNACLYYDTGSDTLYVINKNSDAVPVTYTANYFQYKADGKIYFGTSSASYDSATNNYICTVAANDLLATGVTEFSVVPISSDGVNVTSAAVTINFSKGSATYNGVKKVALRNKPAIAQVNS